MLPEFLHNRPDGFAAWWADRFGTEDLTSWKAHESFVMALMAWEGAMEFAACLPAVDRELATHCRGLHPPEPAADTPVIR